jgi:hypothetical protein
MRAADILGRAARAGFTLNAARRGPAALARREVRRSVYRAEGRAARKALKRVRL